MSDDLVSRLLEHHEAMCGPDYYQAATALTEARAEIERLQTQNARLRKVVSECATALGNGAGMAPSSSIEFIEMLPAEIAKYTDKLRRFLKCARDEGTEALDRALAAESELATVRDMLILCGELGGMQTGETMSDYLRRLIDEVAGKETERELDVANANHRQMATTMADLARKHDALRARVREVVGPFGNLAQRYNDKVSDGWIPWIEFITNHEWPSELDCRAACQLMEDLK